MFTVDNGKIGAAGAVNIGEGLKDNSVIAKICLSSFACDGR